MRILVAGFQHETNTFAPSKATYQNFVQGEGFPAMAHGAEVLALRSVNVPMGGFLLEAEAAGHVVLPVVWAGASPSAHVTDDAFERIAGAITSAARDETFDAVYLDLHGAMVTERHDDGEGELLGRVRAIVGSDRPLVASLDLHANVTERMLAEADALVAYRTYPHVDMAETGRAAFALLETIREGGRLHRSTRRLPFLIPINAMCTTLEPAAGAYRRLAELEGPGVQSLSFAPGFPAADFPECGPVLWGYGRDERAVEAAVAELYDELSGIEDRWAVPFLEPDEAVAEASRLAGTARRPVVIADTQDNPGAGGDSNTTGMLRALVRGGARRAAIGLIWDPDAAAAAHEAGLGATVIIALGGRSGVPGDAPFEGAFTVEHLSDGECVFAGPMLTGMRSELGPCACLRIDDVRVIVSSRKAQMLDRNLFRMGGVEPESMAILVNKSSVHFRADFEPIAEAVLVAKAPGPMAADPADLPWKRLTPGLRIRPGGPRFAG
ncbi:M81 family metallopeptidase [Marinivivus vitaminiproducens]|uniref:M81 family metallopeptidase n=1 Tax=Marinivivus vitaminiproducens TaxID=3035935 RepID=UPI0027A27CF5|nr:M81 family metallopeptidase [Geminicoccaceae bacterium SCSIO 64248]